MMIILALFKLVHITRLSNIAAIGIVSSSRSRVVDCRVEVLRTWALLTRVKTFVRVILVISINLLSLISSISFKVDLRFIKRHIHIIRSKFWNKLVLSTSNWLCAVVLILVSVLRMLLVLILIVIVWKLLWVDLHRLQVNFKATALRWIWCYVPSRWGKKFFVVRG